MKRENRKRTSKHQLTFANRKDNITHLPYTHLSLSFSGEVAVRMKL